MLAKNISLLLVTLLLGACGGGGSSCTSKDQCMTDPNCQCWCSVKCGYRKKNATDHPVYLENDANGKHCYCKQWDLEHFKDNCIEHKNVPEPADAK
ncbi:MAG TPA: hypothetical protein VLG76_06310 [Rhabdochlamydiaceae bacterium]|nr:hypothetical protein [Rhabdochlamydiaceae bacterium]